MLPLAGPDFPASLEDFVAALRGGLADRSVSIRDLQAEGEWPRLAALTLDLTGAKFSRTMRPPCAESEPQPGMSIARLAITAAPLHFETTPLRVDLQAQDAECGFVRESPAGTALQLTGAASGSLVVEAQRADLEATLKTLATAVLAKQGADVKSARLEFSERGPRALSFRAEVTAKAFLMTARVALTGQLDVDDQLQLHVRDLATSGDGVVANLAASLLRPRFAEMEQRVIPLAAFSFAGVKIREVCISGGDALRIEAQFGA